MNDRQELYYAHMESDRNGAEDEYFRVRPQADTPALRLAFKAGFERAYRKLWHLTDKAKEQA